MKKLESGVLKMGNTMAYSHCYNKNCNLVFENTKENCPFSDNCSEFMAVGFGCAKKKTNFDHIREDITVHDFVDMFAKHGCPPGSPGYCGSYCRGHKTCQDCWLSWLNSDYHD